jgi:hypothetical protein
MSIIYYEEVLIKEKNNIFIVGVDDLIDGKRYEILTNGKFEKVKVNKHENIEFIDLKFGNNSSITISKDHVFFIKRNRNCNTEIYQAASLRLDYYIPFSLTPINEKDNIDIVDNHKCVDDILMLINNFYLNDDKTLECEKFNFDDLSEEMKKRFVVEIIPHECEDYDSYKVISFDSDIKLIIDNFFQKNWNFNLNIFKTSIEFRQLLLEKLKFEKNRKYDDFISLLHISLGTIENIEKMLGKDWFIEDGYFWLKIKSIQDHDIYSKKPEFADGYSFTIKNDCPPITMINGLLC